MILKRIFQALTGKILLPINIQVERTAHAPSIREQINVAKTMSENNKETSPEFRQKAQVTLKFCPDHYEVYFKEVIPSMPFKYRLMTKVAVRLGAISIQKLTYMQSDQCFYCKFGSGGFDKKAELPPI
jgi:hypothetical protein